MTFLEALYGSQYYEIHKQGKDGNKGRLNGNLFLSAFIILLIIAIVMVCINFVPGFNEMISEKMRNMAGSISGRSFGKLLAIPVLAIIYFIITRTVGSQENFLRKVETFMQYDDETKKKANTKLLIPFFILLAITVALAISKL